MNIEISKGNINHELLAEMLLSQYNEGNATIEETYAQILHLQKICELAQNSLKEKMCDFVRNNKTYSTNGIEFNFKAGTKRAVYDGVAIIAEAAARLKSLQDISKTLARSGGQPVADIDSGELIQPCCFKVSPDTFSATFK